MALRPLRRRRSPPARRLGIKTALAALLLVFAAVSPSLAGGSIDWKFHALPILQKNPVLLKIITDSLDVSPTGLGVRLGKDFGDEQGKRIPHFKFPARTKGSTGPYNLLLIINDDEPLPWIEIHQ